MHEHPQLLHNMSAPPRSAIKMPKRYDDKVVIKIALNKKFFVGDWQFNILNECEKLTPEGTDFDASIDSYMTKFNLPRIYPIITNKPKTRNMLSLGPLLTSGLLLHASPTLLIPNRRLLTTKAIMEREFYITNHSFLELLIDRHLSFPEIITVRQQRQIVAYLSQK